MCDEPTRSLTGCVSKEKSILKEQVNYTHNSLDLYILYWSFIRKFNIVKPEVKQVKHHEDFTSYKIITMDQLRASDLDLCAV